MNMPAIKAIVGLGNPGNSHYYQRHSIGFRVVDALVAAYQASWKERPLMEIAEISLGEKTILVIKPQTYMNDSGKIVPFLLKQGIKAENVLVVHDELELPFGQVKLKMGGSSKGHNGLRSIIATLGDKFSRLRIGIGRPEQRQEVPNYVLSNFDEPTADVAALIAQAVAAIIEHNVLSHE